MLFGAGFEFQPSPLPFHKRNIRLLHHHPHIVPPPSSTTQLLSGKLNNPQAFDDSTVVEPPVLEYESFSQAEHKPTVNFDKMLRKIIGGDFCHVGLAVEANFDIDGLQVWGGKRERLDGDLVASEGEFHPLTVSTIHTDRSWSYPASIVVPAGGTRESQNDMGRLLPQPYGGSKLVLDQDVFTVLEVVRVDYQTLCERVGFDDTSNDGENARMGVGLVENRRHSSNRCAYFPPPPLGCGGARS